MPFVIEHIQNMEKNYNLFFFSLEIVKKNDIKETYTDYKQLM